MTAEFDDVRMYEDEDDSARDEVACNEELILIAN